jgi:hypothetical protein
MEVWIRESFRPLVVPLYRRTLSCGYSCFLCPFCLYFETDQKGLRSHVTDTHTALKIVDYVVSPKRRGDKAHFHRIFPSTLGTNATDRVIKKVLNEYCALSGTKAELGGDIHFYVVRVRCLELCIDSLYCTLCGLKLGRTQCESHLAEEHIFWSPRFCTMRKHYI